MQILWVVFASSRQINKQKVIEKINLPYTGNEVFVTYQTQGGSNPKSPLAYTLGCTPTFFCLSFLFGEVSK